MSFTSDLQAFERQTLQRLEDMHVTTVTDVHESVTEGSPVTGAPGQPVDVGTLKGSWTIDFVSKWIGQTTTNVIYALPIEEGVGEHGPLTLRSEVGGFHSVKMTVANFDQLVEDVRRRVVGEDA